MSAIRRWLKKVFGFIFLCLVLILPYRWRIAVADGMGRVLDFFYRQYVKMLNWFFRQLKD